MSSDAQHPAVARVHAALRSGGSAVEPTWLADGAHTAAQAAEQLGVPLGAIAKSVLVRCGDAALLCITAGDRRVQTEKLAADWGEPGRADAEFVRRRTGFAIGGVAPLGFSPAEGLSPPTVLMDPSLWRFDTVWAAAGHPRTVFGMAPELLRQLAGATVHPFTDAP